MLENAPTDPEGVILIFGLAGTGKSTLAKSLASHLGLRLIHPSGILRDLLLGRNPDLQHTVCNDGFWETPEGARLLHDRLNEEVPVDVRAHEIMLAEVERGNVVMDTWSLPWLTDKGFRIKLKASLDVRAARAARRAGISQTEARARISQKDEDTRALFLRLHGFDILRDEAHFHLELETDKMGADEVSNLVLRYWQRYQSKNGTW